MLKKTGIVLSITIVVLIAIFGGSNLNRMVEAKAQRGMFIGLGLLSDNLAQESQVILKDKGEGGTVITGKALADLLKKHFVSWKVQEEPKTLTILPDYTVYFSFGSGDRLEFFDGEIDYARVVFKGETKYYSLDQATIEELFMRLMSSSYFVPSEIISIFAESKRTERQSVNDVPQNNDFAVLQMGGDSYYLYEEDGKYYVESPYVFIVEVTESSYKAVLAFIEPVPTTEAQTEPVVKDLVIEPYEGEFGSGFEKVGVLKSGTEVFFKKAGFSNKVEKGEHIVLKSGELAYTVIEGFPGRPEISPSGELMAFIDIIEFECMGNVFVYRDADNAIEQLTQFNYGEVSTELRDNTAKDCLWFDDESVLMIAGFAFGTVSQGGDVYLLNTTTKEKQLIYKANKNEEVANIMMRDGQYVFEIVYWTDDNIINYVYREETYSRNDIEKMK